jgi:hypothetical protein
LRAQNPVGPHWRETVWAVPICGAPTINLANAIPKTKCFGPATTLDLKETSVSIFAAPVAVAKVIA